MLVEMIMRRHVVSIDRDKTVLGACLKFKQYKIGSLVVKNENNSCVGILTERDVIERAICHQKPPETTLVKEIMSREVKTIHPLEKIDKAIKIMKKFHIKKLPVIQGNSIVGMVTITDISYARPEMAKEFMETYVTPRWVD